MELLPAAGYRRMPWKNGGGATFEIAVSPPDAGLDAIDWRISMAIVGGDGPFSLFPGVDRTLTVLHGAGIRLALADTTPILLTQDSEPYAFPGDAPAEAWLLAGPIIDLNVMSRRERFTHNVRRMHVGEYACIETAADAAAVFCCAGEMSCRTADAPDAPLQGRDCALFRTPPRQLVLAAQRPAVILLAEFYRTTA